MDDRTSIDSSNVGDNLPQSPLISSDAVLSPGVAISKPLGAAAETTEVSLGDFKPNLKKRHLFGRLFHIALVSAVVLAISLLCVLLMEIGLKGWAWLDADFLSSYPSRFPHKAGLFSALMGTIWVIGFTGLFSIPIGVGAAIYLEEYAKESRLKHLIEVNLQNLAGVPSIIYGLLGLVVFVRLFGLDRSILSGAMTLSLLILPVIIVASREALRQVPRTIRQAAYALGATKWQAIWAHVLPASVPGILTGVILAISRAVGETAPLIMVGAVAYIAFIPDSPMSPFTVLPIQIYDWTSRPQEAFHELAAAGIIVLLVALLSMNAVAVWIRNHYQRKQKW